MYEFDARAMWGWLQGFPQSRRLRCFSTLVHSQCIIGVLHMHISTSTKVKTFESGLQCLSGRTKSSKLKLRHHDAVSSRTLTIALVLAARCR